MSKYQKLGHILGACQADRWAVSFSDLERLLGQSLPSSAYKYPAWWSNNPANNVMTRIWLDAGWRTEQVDVPGEKVVFRKNDNCHDGEAFAKGLEEKTENWEPAPGVNQQPGAAGAFAAFYGCMKGTVTFAPDYDPAVPALGAEDLEQLEEKWDRLYGRRNANNDG